MNLPSIHSGKAGFLDAFEYYDMQRSGDKVQNISRKDAGLGAFEYVTCYGANLLPNQLLYYPRDYWHQTKCRSTPSIALSGSILDPLLGITLKNAKDNFSTSTTLTQKKKRKKRKKDWNLVFQELMRECDMYITSEGNQMNPQLQKKKPRVFFGNEEVCQRLRHCGLEILPFVTRIDDDDKTSSVHSK